MLLSYMTIFHMTPESFPVLVDDAAVSKKEKTLLSFERNL